MNETVCGIVEDLLPLYEDNVTSKASNKFVEEHIKTCEKCKAFQRRIRAEKESDIVAIEGINEEDSEKKELRFKEVTNKIRKHRKKIILTSIVIVVMLMVVEYIWVSYFGYADSDGVSLTCEGDKLVYKLFKPKRGELVMIDNDDNITYYQIVVGLPNETVEMKSGILYINEVEVVVDGELPNIDIGKITLTDGEYYVVIDKRLEKMSGLVYSDKLGKVEKGDIVGRITIK